MGQQVHKMVQAGPGRRTELSYMLLGQVLIAAQNDKTETELIQGIVPYHKQVANA